MFKKTILLILLFTLLAIANYGQTVGVVLSGGGATANAHVGFLKALEENNIPIDYITGTSMGAIVAAFYAAGYTVEELEQMVTSKTFYKMSLGEIDDQFNFYFKESELNASMVTTKHSKGKFINSTIPTKIINPVLMDYYLMEMLSKASAAASYDFDNLYIPYRCVASNIEDKESVVFAKGNLNIAARASAAYPFYLPPVKIDDKLLYDGGIYNNFPSDILYETFLPDVIIGNNVTGNVAPPDEDELLSQLENMIRHKTNYNPLCDQMIVVEPLISIGTFDFDKILKAIEEGYQETIKRMPEILSTIPRAISPEQRELDRTNFKAKFKPIVIDNVDIDGLNIKQQNYIKRIFTNKQDTISLDNFKKKYFRIFEDDKIESVFPELIQDENTGYYTLKLKIKRTKEINVLFGGIFSSRPINMGFIGFKYNFFGRTSSSLSANSYFGKYYGSVHADYRIDFSGKFPFSIQPEFTFNRWDYFKSFATFFEDIHPSFIVNNERFGGLKVMLPAGNRARLIAKAEYVYLYNDYYQTDNFSVSDTSDQTIFEGSIYSLKYDRNTLNKKYFPNQGTNLYIKAKFHTGKEWTVPGSTSIDRMITNQAREWVSVKFHYTNYFERTGPFQWGFQLEGLASNQPFFDNYKASIIFAPNYSPIPESNTFFIPKHRAYNYGSVGLLSIFTVMKNIDFRGEAYAYRPIGQITFQEDTNMPLMNWNDQYYFLGSASLIYHTPIGPVSLSANYYDFKENPWSFAFNFGYLIFNESVRD